MGRTFRPHFGPGRLTPWHFGPRRFAPWHIWTRTFRPPDILDLNVLSSDSLNQEVSFQDVSDQVISLADIFGPGRFAPPFLDQDVSPLDLDVLPPQILDQDVSPLFFCCFFLDIDVSLPDISDQDVSILTFWTRMLAFWNWTFRPLTFWTMTPLTRLYHAVYRKFPSRGRDPQAIGKRFTFCGIAEHQSECELQLPVVTDWLIQ